jgi:micrococcal nuclease
MNFKSNLKFASIFAATIALVSYASTSKTPSFSQLFDAFFGKEKVSTVTTYAKGEVVKMEVETCTDGDTCRGVSLKNSTQNKIKVRLVGIDAPEFSKSGLPEQPMAKECKEKLNKLIENEKVTVKIYEMDIYKRALGEIFLDDKNINLEMLNAGCAEVYQGRPPKGLNDEPYLAAENAARGSRRGIWASQKYESPKDYRKRAKE